MKFSLILATINRTLEVEKLLESLKKQTHRDFELIVVDQNPDNRLIHLLNEYGNFFPIQHIHSAKGLSRARNIGLKYISGEVVCFPDDDGWYAPSLLAQVSHLLMQHPEYDGCTGKVIDANGNAVGGRYDSRAGFLSTYNVWIRATSFSIFLRSAAIEAMKPFDERLGVGSGTPFGSGEETDFLIQGIKQGKKIYYTPDLAVFHPNPISVYDDHTFRRAFSYGCGAGYVLRKHRYPLWFVIYHLLRPLGGAVLALVQGKIAKARFSWSLFRGRVTGWLS